VDDEIVVATDEGLYDTSFEGAQSVQIRFPGDRGLYRFYQFEAALRRPGLASAVLAGRPVAAAPAAVPAPPSVELSLAAAPAGGRRAGRVVAAGERNLSAVRLYVDGRLVQTIPAKEPRVEAAIDLPDPGGGRWVSAVAIDADGLASLPSAIQIPGPPRPHGTLRAVLVGVNGYQDKNIPALAAAKADAENLARALKTGEGHAVNAVRTNLFVDMQVTRDGILKSVREAARSTGPDDTLLVFYAGHGIDDRAAGQANAQLMLIMSDTRLEEIGSTALSWDELAQALAEARGTVVVVLDACHSGLAASDAFATNDDVVSALVTRAGAPMVVLAGSKGRQLSLEDPKTKGGLFTTALVNAIAAERTRRDREHTGLVDLGGLYSAVKAKVMEATNGGQTPWLTRNGLVGEMALF
jgi:hypothetical protein